MTKFQTFEMVYLPVVSVNRCYANRRNGGKYLKPEAKQWKNILTMEVRKWIDNEQLVTPNKIVIQLEAWFPNGKGRKSDGDNFIKLSQDAIAEAFEVDDCICQSRVMDVNYVNSLQATLFYTVILEDEAMQ